MPLAAEGNRIDPPVSVPSDPKQRPAAVAEPEPTPSLYEEDDPGPFAAEYGWDGDQDFGDDS